MQSIFDVSSIYLPWIFVAVLFVSFLYQLFSKMDDSKEKNFPPYPWFKLPVIGHLHLLETNISIPFAKFRHQVGDVFRIRMGSRDCIVLCGYDVIKDAIVTNGDAFSNRPLLPVMDKITRGSGIVLANDEKWKDQRRFILNTLKYLGMGRSFFEKIIHEEIGYLIKAIDGEGGKEFDPKTYVSTSVANIISTMIFGSTFKHGDPRLKDLAIAIDENVKNGYYAGVINFLPFLDWLPGDLFKTKKVFKNSEHLYAFVEEIIEEHQANFDENSIDDFISAYTKRLREVEKSGESTSFSRKELAGNVIDLFIAGMDTTSAAILWAISLLAVYPDKQQRMFDEILKHVGLNRLPSQEDRANLAYVEAFYSETLRYVNIISSGIYRAVSRDLKFRGYDIPTGTMVILDLGSVLSDPGLWEDPKIFRPERYLNESGSMRKIDFSIPFSTGKRNCLGEPLARMALLLFLSALVQRYKIEWPDGKQLSEKELHGDYRVIHKPKPYEILFNRRN